MVASAGDEAARDPAPAKRATGQAPAEPALVGDGTAQTAGQTALGPLALDVRLDDIDDPVKIRFGKMPRGGLLVNLDTGEVLWRHNPERSRPIASLTKMMTALVAVDELRPADKAR